MRPRWDILKHYTLEIGIYLCAFLFVYAAVSKLLDFETFETQLGQSPLLSAYAKPIAIGVPLLELLISLFLVFKRTRRIALYGFFTMMVMFTAYIVIILNFTDFVPCSCGGVLEALGWTEHMVFNICFIIIAVSGLVCDNITLRKSKSFIVSIVSIFLGGIISISILYLLSEKEIHRNNSFLRRYPPHPVRTIKGLKIKYNSYYIAGVSDDRIYLGNTSAPAHLLSVDTTLNDLKTHQIDLNNKQQIPFYAPQIKVNDSYFFIIDGKVPVIYKGLLTDWKAKLLWKGYDYQAFSRVEVASSAQFVFSGLDKLSDQNVIGRIDLRATDTVSFSTRLLQKQIDGIFDTDGMLRYNVKLDRLLYVYYYRNEFLVADTHLNLEYRGRTIDTVKQASIKISTMSSGRIRQLENKALIVNRYSDTWGKFLFIKSERLGRYESKEMLNDASIVDVYDLKKRSYEFSFYLYHYKGESIKSFTISHNFLIGLSENYLVLYRLQPHYFRIETD